MSENLFSRGGGDRGFVEQFFDTFRRSEPLEPERVLLLAILEEAVHCYRKYSTARDRTGRDRFREAQGWIMGADNNWIFCFAGICELLGLDPQYIRRGLLQVPAQPTSYQRQTKREGLGQRAA